MHGICDYLFINPNACIYILGNGVGAEQSAQDLAQNWFTKPLRIPPNISQLYVGGQMYNGNNNKEKD